MMRCQMQRWMSRMAAVLLLAGLGFGGPAVIADDFAEAPDFNGLEWRNIGPAFMSGRIADVAWHPDDSSVWYVAVGSGGVWKTVNAGVTWTPVFDQQTAYSIGSVTLDPSNPETVWVGTGENVGGRHVAFGDALYRSDDGGHSWTNMGLENSEHISKVIVHPEDSNTLWVAAQGPLWSKGGERGLFPGRALRRDVAASPHGSGLHGRWPQVGYSPLPRWWPQLAEARERPSRWQYRQDR